MLLTAWCTDNSVGYRYQLPHFHIAFQVTSSTFRCITFWY